jgi:hypothetical protein
MDSGREGKGTSKFEALNKTAQINICRCLITIFSLNCYAKFILNFKYFMYKNIMDNNAQKV